MSAMDEHILKTTKEIVVKFIETGRISPSGFPESFKSIYHAIDETVKGTKDKTPKEDIKDD
jgi:predicted transcriptional regulator